MTHAQDATTVAVLEAATSILRQCRERIGNCCDQLNVEQIWSRPADWMNSIGNLLIHLTGNITQWIICGVGSEDDERDRQAEFDERGPIPTPELLARLDRVLAQTYETLGEATTDSLLRNRRVQEWEVTGWTAIWDSVAHFQGHTQEIISMTRLQLGNSYKFWWSPTQ